MTARHGGWVCTYKGVDFYPLDPRPEDILIEDIAHALSLQCRFAGHCSVFYSVAEHSVRVSVEIARRRSPMKDNGWQGPALAGLLHDAAEAYLGDITRPLKYSPGMEAYRVAEKRLQAMIYAKFLPGWAEGSQYDTVIKLADNILLATERRDLMPASPPWDDLPEPLEEVIKPMRMDMAGAVFLAGFHKLLQEPR